MTDDERGKCYRHVCNDLLSLHHAGTMITSRVLKKEREKKKNATDRKRNTRFHSNTRTQYRLSRSGRLSRRFARAAYPRWLKGERQPSALTESEARVDAYRVVCTPFGSERRKDFAKKTEKTSWLRDTKIKDVVAAVGLTHFCQVSTARDGCVRDGKNLKSIAEKSFRVSDPSLKSFRAKMTRACSW